MDRGEIKGHGILGSVRLKVALKSGRVTVNICERIKIARKLICSKMFLEVRMRKVRLLKSPGTRDVAVCQYAPFAVKHQDKFHMDGCDGGKVKCRDQPAG